MIHEIVDMDTQEKVRYINESSNASTSGYSTSPGHGGQHNGNLSPASVFLMSPSPAHSPATAALQTDLANLNIPPNSPHGTTAHYAPVTQNYFGNYNPSYTNPTTNTYIAPIQSNNQPFAMNPNQQQQRQSTMSQIKSEFTAELRIIEQPVEKFRFRYKSEMHGTHGSLNGANSKRSPKTYPEVELRNFNGRAIIRCSLFQTNLDSPHSHQLVVRKDDTDICDPHDLHVSPEIGFVAQFQNMGIIHTAKKYIFEELLKKKLNRLRFDVGREELSTKQMQELHKETEKEAKEMNLNQVRLCFEAFKVESNNSWTRIANPVYTNPINNRKSAQTGELRIVRLSIVTGSVTGGDDLILLVEKVSKKNIKVRFYELNEDEETVWEAYGRFRESDVHHQYAIVCQTPAYKDKEIDKPVEVFIELIRPSDDERSFPPVTFRYKPRDAVVSRKRRRTCSSATASSGSGSSLNSFELPKTIQDQQVNPTNAPVPMNLYGHGVTISEEFNKDKILESTELQAMVNMDSADLTEICTDLINPGRLLFESDYTSGTTEADGATSSATDMRKQTLQNIPSTTMEKNQSNHLQRIFKIYDDTRSVKELSPAMFALAAKQIAEIYIDHAEKNTHSDSIIHEIISSANVKLGLKICQILTHFKLNDLLNRALNSNNQSGLHCACLNDRAHFIRPLLGMGCDPNIQDRHGNTALHIALQEQHWNCVESFLNMKGVHIDLTLRNDEGLTPLHLVIQLNNFDIAKKLLNYEPKSALITNSKDGNNALHMVVRQQNIELVRLILNSPVNNKIIVKALNTAGHTALDVAKSLKTKISNEIVQMLSPSTSSSSSSSFLTTYSDDDEEPGELIIKEEELSSSSTEDDDNEFLDENVTINENGTIKNEKQNTNSNNETKLTNILNNDRKFRKLIKLLNEQCKWKELAKKCQMQDFVCLWSDANSMLTHIRNEKNIKYEIFVAALAEIDRDALDVLLTPLN